MSETALATAFVTIVPSMKGFSTDLKKQLGGGGGSSPLTQIGAEGGASLGNALAGAFKRVAAPLMAAASVAAIGAFVKDGIKQFNDLAGSVKQLQRVTGGSVEAVSAMRGAMQLAGVPVDNINQSVTIFAKKLGNAASSAKDTAAMNKLFGQSIKDSSGNVKSMADLLPGLADKFKAMPDGAQKTALATQLFGRAGAQMIPVLNKGSEGIGELTDKAKAMGLVLNETSMKNFADAKKSAREFAANIQGLKVAVGSSALPVLTAFQNVFRTALTPVIQSVTGFLNKNQGAFQALADTISKFGKGAVGKIGDFFKSLFAPLDGMGSQFGALGGQFASLAPMIMQVVGAFNPLSTLFKAIQPVLPTIIKLVADLALSLGGALVGVLQQLLPPITQVITMLTGGLSQIFVALMPVITQLATSLGGVLTTSIQTLAPIIVQIVQIFSGAFMSVIQMLLPVIVQLAQTIGGMLVELIKQAAPIVTMLVQAIASLLPPLMPLIMQIIKLAIDAIMPLIEAIMPLIKALLPVFVQLITMVAGVIKFLLPIILNLVKFVMSLLIPAIQFVITVFNFIIQVIVKVISWFVSLVTGIVNAATAVTKFFNDLPKTITNLLSGAGKWLVDTGKNLIQGLINGASSLLKNIGKFFLDILPSWIRDPFKAALGIHSPSRVFIEFGKNIIQGLLEGLTKDESSVSDTMQKVADWVTNAFNDGKIYKKTAQAAQKLVSVYTAMLAPVVKEHDAIVAKLNDAQDVLKAKIEERLNYIKSITDKFGSKLNQDEGMTAQSAIDQLKARIAKTKELAVSMAELAKLGLSGDLYQQIIDSGNLDFAKSILAGGAATVQELNGLAEEANKTALDLGTQAGDILFNKGIEVAQGVVDGLKSKEAELSGIMSNIAQSFSNAISNVIAADTRQADTAKAEATAKAQDAAQKAYDAAVKKFGKNSSQAKSALTALNKATTAETAAKATLSSNLKATVPSVDAPFAGNGSLTQQVVNYYAAPNQSLDSEQALRTAMVRSSLVMG